jgi:hypothetical protein
MIEQYLSFELVLVFKIMYLLNYKKYYYIFLNLINIIYVCIT